MVSKSKGIVLSYIKYGESSIIARIFTEKFGYGSFIVNSIRSKKSKKSIGHFQPFSILDMVLYVKASRDMHRVSEFNNHILLHHIHQDLTKRIITLFLTEVFSKLLQFEHSPHPKLYSFAEDSIKTFDAMHNGTSDFHLQFLLKISFYLGYEIEEADSLFSSINKIVPTTEKLYILNHMMKEPYGTIYGLNHTIRNAMLDSILHFYQYHAHISAPKSLEILRSVLN